MQLNEIDQPEVLVPIFETLQVLINHSSSKRQVIFFFITTMHQKLQHLLVKIDSCIFVKKKVLRERECRQDSGKRETRRQFQSQEVIRINLLTDKLVWHLSKYILNLVNQKKKKTVVTTILKRYTYALEKIQNINIRQSSNGTVVFVFVIQTNSFIITKIFFFKILRLY